MKKIIKPGLFIILIAALSVSISVDSKAYRSSSECSWNAPDHWCNFVPHTEYWLCYEGATGSCQQSGSMPGDDNTGEGGGPGRTEDPGNP